MGRARDGESQHTPGSKARGSPDFELLRCQILHQATVRVNESEIESELGVSHVPRDTDSHGHEEGQWWSPGQSRKNDPVPSTAEYVELPADCLGTICKPS